MIALTEFGGSGPELLMLHGSGGGAGDWNDVAEPLTDDFTVIAADLPGHGRSGGLTPCPGRSARSEEHTSELQSRGHLVCRLLLEKKKNIHKKYYKIE